jgi:hypothetical protein
LPRLLHAQAADEAQAAALHAECAWLAEKLALVEVRRQHDQHITHV